MTCANLKPSPLTNTPVETRAGFYWAQTPTNSTAPLEESDTDAECAWGGGRAWFTAQVQHTAAHCSTLQHTAAHCNTLQHTAAHCSTLQHTAAHCSTLQHTPAHCSTLQHTAAHCNTHCNALQHTLQHTATHCNTHCNSSDICCFTAQVHKDSVFALGGVTPCGFATTTLVSSDGPSWRVASAFRCVAVCCSVLQCFALWCRLVRCGALWCSVVCVCVCDYKVSACRRLSSRPMGHLGVLLLLSGVLQCAAVCCSVFQCIAVLRSVLQFDMCVCL